MIPFFSVYYETSQSKQNGINQLLETGLVYTINHQLFTLGQVNDLDLHMLYIDLHHEVRRTSSKFLSLNTIQHNEIKHLKLTWLLLQLTIKLTFKFTKITHFIALHYSQILSKSVTCFN